MIVYRLKNYELQKQLDALSNDYKFSDALQERMKDNHNSLMYLVIEFGKRTNLKAIREFTARFDISEIESYETLDPNTWYEFKKVKGNLPPITFFRVKCKLGNYVGKTDSQGDLQVFTNACFRYIEPTTDYYPIKIALWE